MNRHASINRIYRLVWSQVRSAWVPVAETARGRGKLGRARSISTRTLLGAALSLALSPLVHAAPGGGQIVAGSGSITQSGNTTDIRQSSENLSINWQSFNISAQQTVDFLQPSASAIAVNRIFSANGSEILGHLDANGQVRLINPNGVLFGKGAQVNVGGLVASTLNVGDVSLSGNSTSFGGNGAGSIVNQGAINAANGGYVVLLGNHVNNQGVITAQLGTVALGAGSALTLTFAGNSLVHLLVDQSVVRTLAQNGGLIRADGGRVVMTAGAKDALLASVVNNTGVIEARTVQNHEGTITLLGGMTAGTVNVGGTLDASAPEGGNGGFIETDAAQVKVANDAKVTTAAPKGLYGSWLVDPQDFTVASTGGDITGAALSTELGTTSITLESSAGSKAGSGNVNVDDTVSWSANTTLTLTASNDVNVNENIAASGATAALAINPNTANGAETASGAGTFNLGAGASITLSGANAGLSIATASYSLGAGATINLPSVSPTSTTALVIGGTSYTVINSLGAAGSTTGTDLQGISGNLSGSYALGSNIDASATATWNAGAGFAPIGNSTTPFIGTMDGLGHSISNLTINLPTTNYVGLIGESGTASVIRNVGLIGGSVSGADYVGGLVGQNYGTVNNNYLTGSVSGASNVSVNVGGLVGSNGGTVNSSYITGSVSASANSATGGVSVNVGGLVGSNGGTVNNSYSTGSVSAASNNTAGDNFVNVGRLVGSNGGTVNNSYATGSVSSVSIAGGPLNVGGLVGFNNYGTVSNSYATGSVSSEGNVGGLVGGNDGGTISNSYATGSVSGIGAVGGLVGQNFGRGAIISNSYATGSVSGLTQVGGLVGYNYRGTISNSYATGNVVYGFRLGGLVGENFGGTISNSYATGNVSTNLSASGGYANYGGVGGLVGYSYRGGTISNSYATGSVSGVTDIGGLVGYNSSTVNNSYATGSVSGFYGSDLRPMKVGGLVGYNYRGGTISNSYATGSVSSTGSVGGLVGGSYGGTTTDSFWNVTTSGQVYSAGGTGLTTAQLQAASSLTGWSIATTGGSGDVWRIYEGNTFPLLINFLTPLTLTDAPDRMVTYNGSAQSGASTAISGVLGAAATGTNVGFYNGYYSTQQGYDITGGNLTINQLGSVAWVGGASGNWSQASNWAGGAIPDFANVAAVTIPKGTTVTYDSGVPGVTTLSTLSESGTLVMAAGSLTIAGNLSPAGYQQSGGTLTVGGAFSINSTAGAVTLGNINANSLSITSTGGAITQLASTALGVSGTSNLTANNGLIGASAVEYDITLANVGNWFGGAVSSIGQNIDLVDRSTHGLVLGNTATSGTLTLSSERGALTQLATTAMSVGGASSLTADNGFAGAGDIRYGITLANVENWLGGAVSSLGNSIDVVDRSTHGLILGNTAATGTLTLTSERGAITQLASTAVDVTGASSFTADNGLSGTSAVDYGITLANAWNEFVGAVSADGSAIALNDIAHLTATVDSTGDAWLRSIRALYVAGTIGTNLTTITTVGALSPTTFGTTTVGDYLKVTSTGAVTETSPDILTVHGEGTTTVSNPNVTVNNVKGAEIP